MPIWLRKFTFNKIREFYEQENESYKKSQNPDSLDLTAPSKIPEAIKQAIKQNPASSVKSKPSSKPSIKAS